MAGPFSTKTYLALALGLLFVILSVVVVVLVNISMRRLALTDSEQAARMLLDHNLAIHTYFSQDLKPKLFEQLGPTTSKDYFEPVWMSSTYAIRKIDGYFHHFNKGPYYYKECAINARSPQNEADGYEKAFLEKLQRDPQLTADSKIRVLDGKPYFTLLRRGEAMEESCLRCHSSPEKAPGDLVRHYGPERSFHRKVQDVVQAISIRIPLSEAYSSATAFSYFLSGLLLVALGGGFLFVWVGNKRMVIDPISRIREHAMQIATEHEHLGETIPEPKVRELRDLVAAFNQMSVALKKTYEEQEQTLLERTRDLALERERLAVTLRSIGEGVISTDTGGRVTGYNRKAEELTGWTEEDALGRALQEVFVIVNEQNRESCENPVEKVPKTGGVVGLANGMVLIAKDGTERILADSGAPIRDEAGNMIGVVLVFRDVTEQRAAERILEESEFRYRTLFDNMSNAVAVYRPVGDGEDFVFLDFNKSGERIDKVSKRDLLGRRVLEAFPGVREFGLFDVFQQVWRTGIPQHHPLASYRDERIEGWRDNFVYKLPSGEIVAVYSDETDRRQAEERLRESERRYRELVQDANSAIIRWKSDGTITYFNEYAQSLFGYSLGEAVGQDVGILVPEKESTGRDLSMLVQDIVKQPQRYVNNINENVCRDGRRIWMAWTNKAILDQEGLVTEILAVGSDISAQKKTEAALQASDERYRRLFQHAPIMYVITRNEQGVPFITDCNELFLGTLGYSREAVVEKPLADFYTPESKAALLERGGYARALAGQYFIDERQLLCRNGALVPTLLYTVPELDSSGNVLGTRAMFVDITDLKAAEAALNLKNCAVESSISGIFIAGLDGNLIYVNKSALDLWGYDHEEEVLGKRALEFWTSEKEVQEAVEAAMKSGSWIGELVAKHKEGFPLDVQAAMTLVKGINGEPIAVMGSFLDISERKRTQEAIQRAKDEWERTFDAVPDLISILDRNNRILRVNRAMAESLHVSPEEAVGRICYQVVHGTATPPDFCPHVKMLKDGKQHSVEMYEEALGGHFLVTVSPLSDSEGRLMGCVHVARNVSSQKAVEENLRESEEKFSCAFQFAPMPMAITSLGDGRVVEVNEAFLKGSGYERDEVLGKTALEIGTWKDGDERALWLEQIKKTGSFLNLEMDFPTKYGTLRHGLFSAVMIHLHGKPMLLSAFNDITERKQAEEALRQSEGRYRSLFEESVDGIFVTSREGLLVDANQSFLDIFGYKREAIVGRDVHLLYVNPSDRDSFVRAMEKSGALRDYPVKMKRMDGTELDCLLTSHVRRAEDGTILGFQGILRDVTEYANLQKQLIQAQKMEAIGALAGGVAHDFNNVLQVGLGYSELMLGDESLPQRCRTDLKKIYESSRKGADLVQRLLTFSRKTDIKLQPVDLNRRITELKKMLERTLPKMVEIQLSLGEDLPSINADPTQIDQVLMNLAVNARDAMPEGGKLIFETTAIMIDEEYARSYIEAAPGHHVLLMVTDTGSGMDQDTLLRIFEPFYTTKGVGEGTGLGLAMVHGIVKQHGGHIKCYSELAHGTTFKIYLPAIVSEEEVKDSVVRAMPRGGSETILLVDDEELIRDLGSRILKKVGYKVITASDGEEAVGIYRGRADEISLVVLDVIMPKMGGKQCLEALLSLNPTVKVVIASGFSSDGPTKDALAAGAKGFVSKPYDIRQVLEVVREVLDAE